MNSLFLLRLPAFFTRAIFFFSRNGNRNRSAFKFFSVQLGHSQIGFCVRGHFDKSKTTASARFAVSYYFGG